MSLKDQTPVAQSKFIDLLKEEGVQYTVQTGFIRVEGPKGRRLYIANTQKVKRVDISGFKVKHGAHEPIGGEFGRVMQQLDFKNDEEVILKNFLDTVRYMMQLPPSETSRELPQRGAPIELASRRTEAPRPSAPASYSRAAADLPTLGEDRPRKKNRSASHPRER